MIYVFGGNGYLASHILKKVSNYKIVKSIEEIDLEDKNSEIWFFATPNDDSNIEKLLNSLYLTESVADFAEKHKIKFVLASSEAVLYWDSGLGYPFVKKEQERSVETLDNFKIFRIPRVYSRDREHGLIKKIKDNEIPLKDMNKKVRFTDINSFVSWFLENVNSRKKYVKFKNHYKMSILQIKNIFDL